MVEILIVLVILAVIAGGASGIMGGTITKTKYVTAQTDLDVISQGFARYLELTWDLEGIVNGADLDSCLTGTRPSGVSRIDIFQSAFGKKLEDFKDPWGRQYYVISNYDASTKKGTVAVACRTLEGAASHNPGKVGELELEIGEILSDKVSLSSGRENPMFRIVYNDYF